MKVTSFASSTSHDTKAKSPVLAQDPARPQPPAARCKQDLNSHEVPLSLTLTVTESVFLFL